MFRSMQRFAGACGYTYGVNSIHERGRYRHEVHSAEVSLITRANAQQSVKDPSVDQSPGTFCALRLAAPL